MADENQFSTLERAIEYAELRAKEGKPANVANTSTEIRAKRSALLRQGIPLPPELDERSHNGSLETLRSDAYLNYILNGLRQLIPGLAQAEPRDIYARVAQLEQHIGNVTEGTRRAEVTNALTHFQDSYAITKAMDEATYARTPDTQAIRDYVKHISNEQDQQSVTDRVNESLRLRDVQPPLFLDEDFDKITRNIVQKVEQSGSPTPFVNLYGDAVALATRKAEHPNAERFLGFLTKYVADAVGKYMDLLEGRLQNGERHSSMKRIYNNALSPAVGLGLVDKTRVANVRELIYSTEPVDKVLQTDHQPSTSGQSVSKPIVNL